MPPNLASEGGYSWIVLADKGALDAEQRAMNTAVTQNDDGASPAQYFSLRDKSGTPHVIVEVRDHGLAECYGRNDKRYPGRDHVPSIKALIQQHDWFVGIAAQHCEIISVTDPRRGGKNYDALHPPPRMTVPDSLDLFRCHRVTDLPRDYLSVDGSLDIRGTQIKRLPRKMRVEDYISTDIGLFQSVKEARAAFAAKYPEQQPSPRPPSANKSARKPKKHHL
ncbi:MAG: hypothetical protein WDO70_03530 [Alphaproteobacteria bacterium]